MPILLHFSIFLLLLPMLAGCSDEQPRVPGGYNIDFFNNYREGRTFQVIVTDGGAGPGYSGDHLQGEFGFRPGEHAGPNLGCVGFADPFNVKIIMRDKSVIDGGREIETKKWVGIECGGHYTLVIDESSHMQLYEGYQTKPPYKHPMLEAPAPKQSCNPSC